MITSNSNERIKAVVRLETDRSIRHSEGLYVAEGEKMFSEAPKDHIKSVFISENYLQKCSKEIARKLDITGYETVSDSVFLKISDTKTPQGILCVLKQQYADITKETKSERDSIRILITERIQDPGNLGTMIRTAEGAGFDLLITDDKTVDIYNPKVIRATMGSIFRMKIAVSQDLKDTITRLKSAGITVYAAHLKGKNSYRDEKYGKKLAFLIGNEGNGLSDEISGMADKLIRIPMEGKVESLNASVAAALLMYESKEER
ncbi:MAG: RNA methyltransferase [Lachnospiraceae bacterium]|nr:RNA methyltransferase [Lachnospiraceae bacterium]